MISIFNKKLIAAIILASSLLFISGCSGISDKSKTSLNDTKVKSTTASDKNNSKSANNSEDNNKSGQTSSQNNTSQGKSVSSGSSVNDQNVSKKVKDYILNGQNDKSEAQKIKWSKTFLDEVDIDSLYKMYKANGGKADDIESFAVYITQNAPISSNWQELFKKDLKDTYGEDVVKLVDLGNNLYQAYVMKDGSEVPYVAVSARTGYFHG